ncbi:ammonium transporter [Novosphingobium sp. CF614]|uniref:ammonium transporter n=1 Tax=Novosphingobium sp. CF614 TaxID=1884364 RepID=UPI0008F09F51|nr:ammonium transporter [Novosphingobium sp. CF614]SFG24971.1 ammonium transporter [Novosphingobium sp. CF614]
MTKQLLLPIAAMLALLPGTALAQDGRVDVANSGDTAWLLAASALVTLVALPGLSLFQGGMVRARNFLSVLVQCGAIVAAASIAWVIVGYTVSFGDVGNGWLGSGNAWMLITLGNVREGTAIPESAFVLFQMAFAVAAPALMAGAWAERARFGWVITFCMLWSLVVYAPVAHWIWGGGWLAASVGTVDWAGGIVVHATAGVSALVAAIMLGERKGFLQTPMPPHSPALTMAGAALLWVGWFGFSGGSALAANDDAAAAIIATHVAAAAAALTWLAIERLTAGKPTGMGFARGAIAGLVIVTPAAGFISPGSAILFGAAGAAACFFAIRLVKRKLRIDDSLDVFAVHGVGGMLGAVLTGIFMSESLGGTGYGERMNMVAQIVAQIIGVGVVAVWSVIATAILALMASILFPMRVSEDAEREGLDITSHGGRAGEFD